MMELGQPMHAFDVREVKGAKIIIDRALKGEVFTTLDGSEITLDGSELTIRDAERAVALAGVVGGKNSGIQDDTVEIFLESAYFTADGVRRVSRKFGIETDSAYRFARGTNPEAVVLALNRAAQLIQSVAGGEILGDHHDVYPNPVKHSAIEISHATLVSRLGYSAEASEFLDWMKRLGCEVTETGRDASGGPVWSVLPPTFRWDLALDMDLVEEFARLHGYQHIPETLPALKVMPAMHDMGYVLEQKIRRLLQGEGCLQALNYGFISRAFQARVLGDISRLANTGLRAAAEPVALVNPLNEEINVMRMSLIPGLIKNVVHNSRHGNSCGRLFEVGATHFALEHTDGAREYNQESRLAFAFWGAPEGLWNKAKPAPTVFVLKGVIENLLKGLSITGFKWIQGAKAGASPEFLHPGQAAVLQFQGKPVGYIGTLHPVLAEELKVRESCALAEINLEKLLSGQPKSPKYTSISRFPAVDRDLAFAMPVTLLASDVEAEIRKAAGPLLKDVTVFDVFEGGTLEAGHKSVAFRMIFQSADGTLEDQAVNELRDKVVKAVGEKFAITLRG
jgi:phenylalanyl-tRNA synthetase beta chain